jgi:hypothetical protein
MQKFVKKENTGSFHKASFSHVRMCLVLSFQHNSRLWASEDGFPGKWWQVPKTSLNNEKLLQKMLPNQNLESKHGEKNSIKIFLVIFGGVNRQIYFYFLHFCKKS